MSVNTPEEDAGFKRFTVVIPTHLTQKIDVLMAFAGHSSRNQVITDAIEFLDFVSSQTGLAFSKMNASLSDDKKESALKASESNIQDYVRTSLVEYWKYYKDIFQEQVKKDES